MAITSIFHSSKFLKRHCPEFYLDLNNWPQVDSIRLAGQGEKRFKRLCAALQLYFNGAAMSQVSEVAGVSAQRWRVLLKAALSTADDGRIHGYRAFTGSIQLKERVRNAERNPKSKPNGGYSGLFSKIFRDHPKIELALIQEISGRAQNEDGKWVKVIDRNELDVRQAHRRFLAICRQNGITQDEYPLNTTQKARKPFEAWIRDVYRRDHASKWAEVSGNPAAAQSLKYQNGDGQSRPPAKLYANWQVDEYKIDAEGSYEFPDERGDIICVKLHRCSLILVSEVASGANLGAKIVYNKEPKAEDIVALFWEILAGELPRHSLPSEPEFVDALEGYIEGSGFPTEIIPALRFLCPTTIEIDNALSHLSDAFQSLITHTMGSAVRLGKPKTPQTRSNIESKFSLMARRLMRQVPGATGSHPRDPLRDKQPPVEYRIRAEELEFVIDAYLRNQNALPNAAANYSSALQKIERNVSIGKINLVALPAQKRKAYFFYPPIPVTIKTSKNGHRAPFINFNGRYSSTRLRKSWGLAGSKMLLRLDPRNVQQCWLFHMDGTEFGPVVAEGKWGNFPHSLQIKKLIKHLQYKGEMSVRAEDAPLDALFAYLRKKALHSKVDANRLASISKYYNNQVAERDCANELIEFQNTVEQANAQATTLLVPQSQSLEAAQERVEVPSAIGNSSPNFIINIPSLPRRQVR